MSVVVFPRRFGLVAPDLSVEGRGRGGRGRGGAPDDEVEKCTVPRRHIPNWCEEWLDGSGRTRSGDVGDEAACTKWRKETGPA